MKQPFVVCGSLACALVAAGAARADSQVSLDVSGVVAQSPFDTAPRAGESRFVFATLGEAQTAPPGRDAILGVDVRPSFGFAKGLRIGVGFRAGRASSFQRQGGPLSDPTAATLIGGDVSFGYQRFFSRLMPFTEVRFGFNSYDLPEGNLQAQTMQLRLSAVVGARLYLGPSAYIAASVFGGYGDRFGGALGLGWDVIRYRYKGVLP